MTGTFAERLAQLRKRRRKLVKRWGKRALRRLNRTISAQSLVPDVPVFDPGVFPFVKELEAGWPAMRAELDRLLRYRDDIPRFYEVSRDQKRISKEGRWKTFVFQGWGIQSALAGRLCPETTRLLSRVPRLESAFFSILAPGASIPRHTGVFKGLVRCHIPLLVPRRREDCVMWVDDAPYSWEEGQALVFDDTFPHEVRNDTDESRVVLLFDFERPMRPFGRVVTALALGALKRTAYVREAARNHAAFEERFAARLAAEGVAEAAAPAPVA